MKQVLKVGQRLKMSNSEIAVFAHDFLSAAADYVKQYPGAFTVAVGKKTLQVQINAKDNLSPHIKSAFIPSPAGMADFTLAIWRSGGGVELPNLNWARNYLVHDNLVPASLTNPYRIAFDKSQGFIYLYDEKTRHGAIWIAEDSKISLNSFVTPFRIMISWMAESFGGEIIHASAISKDGKGIIINGPSGSGKSTLALLCALEDFHFIADDVVLYHDGFMSAIYRYAKVDAHSSPCDLSSYKLFQMDETKDAKNILDLFQLGDKFQTSEKASALVLPIFAHLNQHAPISPSIAIKLLAPNSLRELMGGTPYNFRNLVNLTRQVPSYRIALSSDNAKNVNSVATILSELS